MNKMDTKDQKIPDSGLAVASAALKDGTGESKKSNAIILCLHNCELFQVYPPEEYQHQRDKKDEPDLGLASSDVETIMKNLPTQIDQLGHESAQAQQLKSSVTTYAKLMQNQDNEYFYFMIDDQYKPKGFIRICRKKLFLDEMEQLKECENCLCVMDFFVLDRREGSGLKLIQAASNDLNLQPRDLLIDRPSDSMINFMNRHFKLKPFHHFNKFASFV